MDILVKLEIAEYSWTKFEPEIDRQRRRVTLPRAGMKPVPAGILGADHSFVAISGVALVGNSRRSEERLSPLRS